MPRTHLIVVAFGLLVGPGTAPTQLAIKGPLLLELVCIGVLAIRSGRTIEWDAAGMRVKGSPEFDRWIKEPARPGWRYGEELA